MQMLANMVFGAVLAGLSLGPAAWADAAQVGNDMSRAVMIVAGKECVLAIEGNRPDGSFDGVGVDLDPGVVNKASQAIPA